MYLGFSVAFGPMVVRAADRRFGRRFGERSAPGPGGATRTSEWALWTRCLLACATASAALGLLVLVAGDPERTRELWADGGWFLQLGAISVVWLALGPVWAAAAGRSSRLRRERHG